MGKRESVWYAVKSDSLNGVFGSNNSKLKRLLNNRDGASIRRCASQREAQAFINHPELFDLSKEELKKNPIMKKFYKNSGVKPKPAVLALGHDKSVSGRFSFSDNYIYAYAYIDGSFNSDKKVYGYGGFIDVAGRRYVLSGSGCEPDYLPLTSTAGEVCGVLAVFSKIRELGLNEIVIYHDSMVIQHWLMSDSDGGHELRRVYRQQAKSLADNGVVMKFNHVKSHVKRKELNTTSNTLLQNRGIEIADRLARESVGLVSYRPLPISFFDVTKTYLDEDLVFI